jgi:DNA-binding XRE family transcriptional regulator
MKFQLSTFNFQPSGCSQPVASQVQTQAGRSAGSLAGRLATFKRSRQTQKTQASAMLTPKNAHDVLCAGLNAGIRRVLDVSRVPKSGFVARQIAIHGEFQSRQAVESTVATRLQTALNRLEEVAVLRDWSQTKLAKRVGIKESTFRKVKMGRADSALWLPKLEAAVARLAKPEVAL